MTAQDLEVYEESVQKGLGIGERIVGNGPTNEEGEEDLLEDGETHDLLVDYSDVSSLEDGTSGSSIMSATSTVFEFVEENGRTYHKYKEGKYFLPNDELERSRLDLQHQLWAINFNGELSMIPNKNPAKVLDIGTGTGNWAIDFALKHPDSQVIGSDLSPIQPDYIPPNCHFEIEDAEDQWNYSHKFDFIHGRALVTCFDDHRVVIKSAFDALVPGGYLELQDGMLPFRGIDDSCLGTALETWSNKCVEAAAKLGHDWTLSKHYAKFLKEAGFVDIVEKRYQFPLGSWAKGQKNKMIGKLWLQNIEEGIDGMSMAILTRGGGMTREEVLEMTSQVKNDLRNKAVHAFIPALMVYGRKPE